MHPFTSESFRHTRVESHSVDARKGLVVLFSLAACICATILPRIGSAQNLGSASAVTGTVTDPSGAVIGGATVTILNPVSGFTRTTSTDSVGSFTISNVPFNPYHLTV